MQEKEEQEQNQDQKKEEQDHDPSKSKAALKGANKPRDPNKPCLSHFYENKCDGSCGYSHKDEAMHRLRVETLERLYGSFFGGYEQLMSDLDKIKEQRHAASPEKLDCGPAEDPLSLVVEPLAPVPTPNPACAEVLAIPQSYAIINDDDEVKPKAAEMKVDTDPAATKTREEARALAIEQGGIRMEGAMGPNAYLINGVYEATDELSGDVPVYVKVGSFDTCLEYRAAHQRWQVKRNEHKGTDISLAVCAVPVDPKCLPQNCPVGKWQIVAVDKLIPLPAITISVASEQEVAAYRAEVEREAARVVKGCHVVRITGAMGTYAGYVNGEYKPTEEMCGNAPVYAKVLDRTKWMEYNASSQQWQVKSTSHKGKDGRWAACAVPTVQLIEQYMKYIADQETCLELLEEQKRYVSASI